jgi:3-deoxy-D-manno-octulosonate 8-phosphate phosphatase (KDO 8-P phosphatase)
MKFNATEQTVRDAASAIKLLLLDVDGVLTDGRLYYSNSGEEMKAFSTLDGHGIKMLRQNGVEVGIITGRQSELLARRAAELGISLLYQGREDKLNVFADILAERQLSREQIAYAGDDFPDLPVLTAVGLSFSVPAGHPDVRMRVDAITDAEAGLGAVREIGDFILQCQDKYQQLLP